MREALFEQSAPKQTVSVTLNSDLYAKAKKLGINTSRIAEEALATAYAAKQADTVRAAIQQEVSAINDYIEKHGSFAEQVRAHYEKDADAV
jgi:post-segregation antitoxin (ccd killing protein)